jgi:hypothetical protein
MDMDIEDIDMEVEDGVSKRKVGVNAWRFVSK